MFNAPESPKILECNLIYIFKWEEERALWSPVWILSLTSFRVLWIHLGTVWLHWIHIESFLILSIQTITFLKLVLLLLSTCKKLCEHLCKLQHRRRRILGSRALSYPCLQRVCVQPSPLFLHHTLWISCSTTSLLTATSRGLSCWFYVCLVFFYLSPVFSSTKCVVSFWQLVLSSNWYQTRVGFCESLAEILQWVD